MCFADDRLEELVAALGEDEAEPHVHSMTSSAVPEADKPWELETELRDGEIVEPWTTQPEFCPEESETPDPLSFNEEILHFMEMSVDEAKEEYLGLIDSHVTEEMKQTCPQVVELLHSQQAQDFFAPNVWDGMLVPPVQLIIKGNLPQRMCTRARPVRRELFETAKKEFERLRKYFYEESNSPRASPLVIAPKATAPFIRFCGDYREVNEHITIPPTTYPYYAV